jgi:hypothetical protein
MHDVLLVDVLLVDGLRRAGRSATLFSFIR